MDYLESLLATAAAVTFNNASFFTNMAIIFGIILILSIIGRFIFGRQSGLNHAVSSGIGILFLYLLGILLYGTNTRFSGLLASLPFVAVKDGVLAVFSFHSAAWQESCSMVVRMIMLAFFVNLLDALLPKGKNLLMWLLFRLITVFSAVLCQALIVWISVEFLPDVFVVWAPIILLGILVVMLLLGALKLLVGIALTAVNPIIAAIYTFFFSNFVGKQLSRSVLTTLLLSVLVIALNHLGIVAISLIGIAWTSLLPVILVLLAIWYLVSHVL